MTAATEMRMTKKRGSLLFSRQVAANVKIFEGTLVCLSPTGFAQPGATSATLKADGRANTTVDNTGGANGAKLIDVEKGTFQFANSAAADLITIADISANAFVVDDQTVAKTNAGNTRSVAGKIVDVDARGVWVQIG